MSDVAQYTVRDGVAVITMNNPPVNGLGNALRAGLMEGLKKAESDPAVQGVVLIGSERPSRAAPTSGSSASRAKSPTCSK